MAKDKPQFDYNKITLEEMVNYVIENKKKDVIDLKSFNTETEEYKLVNVIDAEGKPQTYVSKKDGKVKIKKKQVKTGKKTTKYNFLKAKRAFYEAFKDDIDWINPPKAKSADAKKKATDILALLDE